MSMITEQKHVCRAASRQEQNTARGTGNVRAAVAVDRTI
jgi:hypothetical protein